MSNTAQNNFMVLPLKYCKYDNYVKTVNNKVEIQNIMK
jgi:hypothetical protein